MENNQFDEQIKASMQHLELPYHAAHWQQMESTLKDLEKQATASAEDAFDALISDKLENIAVGIQMPDWNRMEAVLEEAGVSNQKFDSEVKTKIALIQPAYQPSHWELLAERLRREKATKESLFKNKLSELVIFTLLLLNFYQYIPNHPAVKSLPIITEPIEEKQQETSPLLVEIPTIETTKSVPYAQEDNKEPIRNLVEKSARIASPPTTSLQDNRLFISPMLHPIAISGVSSKPSLQQVVFGIDGKAGLTITVSEMTRHLAILGLSNSVFVETIPSLEPASLGTATVPLGCEKCKKPKVPGRFRFGMIAHVGGTSAARREIQILSTDALIQKGGGYGLGFSLGLKKGNVEIETVIGYASKSYAPNIDDPYKKGSGVNLKQFTGINLQTLRIPVNARYNYKVLGEGNWHLYGQVGAAMNLILIAEYDIVDIPQANNKLFNDIAASSRLSRINYNRGIFGGDDLTDNTFTTLNLGLGAEYYLSPKWSVFAEPEYNYYLSYSRIGPTQDRINSLAVSFGIRTTFY